MNRVISHLVLLVWLLIIPATRAQTPDSSLERRYNAGVKALDAEKWNEAVAHFDAVLESLSDETASLHGRGWALGRLGKWDASIRDYSRAIQLNSKDADAFVGRALSRKGAGDYAGLVADMEEATRLDPENAVYLDDARSTRNFSLVKWIAIGMVGVVTLLGLAMLLQLVRSMRAAKPAA